VPKLPALYHAKAGPCQQGCVAAEESNWGDTLLDIIKLFC